MNIKKLVAALALSALMAVSMGALAGCADNSEQVIRDSLTEEIDQLKNPDEATLSELSSSIPASSLAQLGITPDQLVSSLLAGFDGTVDSVTVNGNSADAVLTLSSKNFTEVQEAMMNIQTEMTDDPSQFADMSVDEIKTWAGERIMSIIDEAPVEVHEPITVNYVRNGNTWEPGPGAEAAIYNTLFG